MAKKKTKADIAFSSEAVVGVLQKKYGKEAIPRDVKKILGKRAMFSLRSDLPCRAFHTIASMSILAR